jgi:hypothetical protein
VHAQLCWTADVRSSSSLIVLLHTPLPSSRCWLRDTGCGFRRCPKAIPTVHAVRLACHEVLSSTDPDWPRGAEITMPLPFGRPSSTQLIENGTATEPSILLLGSPEIFTALSVKMP